jgi:hypothetical protein
MDAFDFLKVSKTHDIQYRAIFLDPPRPINTYTRDTFTLDEVNPRYEELIESAVACAPVVAFRIPNAMQMEPIQAFGERFRTIVHRHHIEGQNPKFDIKTAYLIKGGRGFSESNITLRRDNGLAQGRITP